MYAAVSDKDIVERRIGRAVTVIAGLQGIDEVKARAVVHAAAARAGVSAAEIAYGVLLFHTDQSPV